MNHQICTPERSYKGWVVYDSFLLMQIHQTLPPYKTKFEAEQECRKLNTEYKALGIKKGQKYYNTKGWEMLQ